MLVGDSAVAAETETSGLFFVFSAPEEFKEPLRKARSQTESEYVNARYMVDVFFAFDLIVMLFVNAFCRKTYLVKLC